MQRSRRSLKLSNQAHPDSVPAKRTTIGGYGELHYNNISAEDSSRDYKSIDFHRFVLFFGHEFNDSTRFYSEVELEHSFIADTGGNTPGEVELEQAYIEWDLRDNLHAKGGLFLVPVGILNQTHEPNTFYGVERNDVENIIIPDYLVGRRRGFERAVWFRLGLGPGPHFRTGHGGVRQ